MPILNIETSQTGLSGVLPRWVYILTNDTLAEVMATGYLNKAVAGGASFSDAQAALVACKTSESATSTQVVMLEVSKSGADWSLIASPTPSGQFITKDITCTAAALATAGKVNVQSALVGAQFKVRNIFVNYSAAGLSGGGGDRLLSLTDGTTSYNNAGITAALLGTPVNTVWGGSGNPLAGTVAQNTSTAVGAQLYLQYAGGTTDFSTGSVVITVAYERVV